MIWLVKRTVKGLGDAVMLEPTISLLGEVIRSHDEIWVQTLDWIAPIFYHHPKINKILTEKEAVKSYATIKTVLDISNDEDCPAAKYEASNSPNIVISRQQRFVEASALTYDNRRAILYLSNEEKEYAKQLRTYMPGIKVGIQVSAAETWRDYYYMTELIKLLHRKTNWHLLLFNKDEVPNIEGTIPIVGKAIREVMWTISAMDIMICPDSGLARISAALGIETYCIFGPTDPVVRMATYGNHVHWNKEFTLCGRSRCWYKPCKRIWCLRLLSPQRVYKDVRKFLEEKR